MGREEVQERLIARMRGIVEQTKIADRDAKAAFELAKDLPLQDPDSGYAMRQALRRENQKLLDYKRAAHRFNRLILDGKLPDEPNEPPIS